MPTSRDGRHFPSAIQVDKWERHLDERRVQSQADKARGQVEDAPGGPLHEHAIRQHGPVTKSVIEADGNGRWRHSATHANGETTSSVHPEAFRAHQVQAQFLGIDEAPPAIKTHQRAKSHPVGEKEGIRLDREDHREVEDSEER